MEFDLFYELALPPMLARTESEAYADTLAQMEAADALDFRCAWLVEHHFLRGYSHASKPELVLAAAAQRTHRLRLGLAVIPAPLHHPVHVAERVATLDILSGGRLDVGLGRGFSPQEYGVFGAQTSDGRARVAETLDILRLSFQPGPLTYHGRFCMLENVDIVPRAVQRPHPPLWTAAVSPETYPWAAAENLGVLSGPFKPWFMVRHDLARFTAAWRGADAPRIGMTLGVLCLADGARARALARPAFTWFYRELFRTTAPVLERLYPGYEHIHEFGRFRALIRLGVDFGFADAFGLTVVGTPAECRAKLAKYAEAGVTHILCAFGAGALDPAVAQESMSLFARDVAPGFRAP